MRKIVHISLILAVLSVCAVADVYIPSKEPISAAFEGKCSMCRVHNVDPDFIHYKEINHNYDVQKYTLDVYIDDVAETLDATVTVNMDITENGVTQIELDLDDADLTVTQCRVGGSSRSFTHSSEVLTVNLGSSHSTGDNIDIAVDYNGSPSAGLHFYGIECYTFTEPTDSKYWYPCYDLPSDKAEEGVELFINVRDDWDVASNGILQGITTPSTGRKEFHWLHQHSIAQYLIAFGAREYHQFSDTWEGMDIDYWVLPGQETSAPISFANMPDMFDCFKPKFGDYPYKDEKYGMYMGYNYGGGMEHQTNTIMGSWVADGDDHDWIIAHEVAHQWWGDNVTCGTWMDLWLNEGFATYSDALYCEHENGDDAFQARMNSFANSYFNEDAGSRFPIYNPDILWGSTVYRKGAWILHMLRHEMDSDTQFFDTLQYYRSQHEPDIAVTAQLQEDIEAFTGDDWDWFFDQWVYKAGYPEFEWYWENTKADEITVHIAQTQTIDSLTPVFQTHIDLELETVSGTEIHTVWVADEDETFVITASDNVTDVTFDPNSWLLCKTNDITAVEMASFTAAPTHRGIRLDWETVDEYGDITFNIYREVLTDKADSGNWVRLNDTPISGVTPYGFLDANVKTNIEYSYWLEALDGNETTLFGPASAKAPVLVKAFILEQNSPNPVTGNTAFAFSLPTANNVELAIYDLSGRKIAKVVDAYLPAGNHNVAYSCSLPSGVYLYQLKAGNDTSVKKMIVSNK